MTTHRPLRYFLLYTLCLSVGLLSSLFWTTPALAESDWQQKLPTATVLVSALNVRNGPGLNYARLGSVGQGDQLTVLDVSDGCAWLQVNTPQGLAGWVSGNSQYVRLGTPCADLLPIAAAPESAAAPTPVQVGEATVLITALNVRSGPGLNYTRLGSVGQGDRLTVLDVSNGCAWLQVSTPQGLAGWVSGNSQYVGFPGGCGQPEAAVALPPARPQSGGGRAAPLFGVQILTNLASAAAQAHVNLVRYGEIHWDQVESVQGQRNWQLLQPFEQNLQALSAAGLKAAVVVLGTPGWAQRYAGVRCGPIAPHALDDFASFMAELVARYSRPPYNVTYWELGNEPDVDRALVSPDSGFGCWGESSDPYYGGGYYGEMLKQVYPAMKAQNPNAQVMNGGLLLDCNPDNPPRFNGQAMNCEGGRFLEGVLRAGGGNYLDILAFHAYTFYAPGIEWDLEHLTWAQNGGIFSGKVTFLRQVMARYGVDLPLLMNEGGMFCHPNTAAQTNACPAEANRTPEADPAYAAYFDAQANYVIRLFSRTAAWRVMGSIWYTLDGPGWRQGGLMTGQSTPRPALRTLTFFAQLLAGATYAGPLGAEQLEGYRFVKAGRAIDVYWTNSQTIIPVPLPSGPVRAVNKYGETVAVAGGSVQVGFDPVILIGQ